MPIDWHSIEAEISIPYLKKVHPRTGIDNGKKVAVIGGGPAGITAALGLREKAALSRFSTRTKDREAY